ncbi:MULTISPECIES: COP23 domain-containing protein [unclassified Leptolyngbya]|uniref:COP23 domain-containing protein n=1 Tax=unclassified Leptolyngbya TaxID=2650499 RepID=UPI0016838DFB|nr:MULTISPECIES: COP23 domain-containing protein [unclassified Leptolyngbya]MBD1911353.1 hypothetical protein [Leptolyngbya sp. FACHB-8]MBD2156629.1 hypothetical protein [Leptolyngbya sp. FACHB-16]
MGWKAWVVTAGTVAAWVGMGVAVLAASVDGTATKQSSQPSLNDVRFSCQVVNGQYVVVYTPENESDAQYPWAEPTQLGGGWTPELRCAEISRRLESYRPDGLLELQTGTENGYNTICVTTERASGCRIVLTVPPGQDPLATRDRVFENLVVADSGQRTDAVTTFNDDADDILGQIGEVLGFPGTPRRGSSSSDGINLRPFLSPADGGTGEYLNGPAGSGGQRLNPDRFR